MYLPDGPVCIKTANLVCDRPEESIECTSISVCAWGHSISVCAWGRELVHCITCRLCEQNPSNARGLPLRHGPVTRGTLCKIGSYWEPCFMVSSCNNEHSLAKSVIRSAHAMLDIRFKSPPLYSIPSYHMWWLLKLCGIARIYLLSKSQTGIYTLVLVRSITHWRIFSLMNHTWSFGTARLAIIEVCIFCSSSESRQAWTRRLTWLLQQKCDVESRCSANMCSALALRDMIHVYVSTSLVEVCTSPCLVVQTLRRRIERSTNLITDKSISVVRLDTSMIRDPCQEQETLCTIWVLNESSWKMLRIFCTVMRGRNSKSHFTLNDAMIPHFIQNNELADHVEIGTKAAEAL